MLLPTGTTEQASRRNYCMPITLTRIWTRIWLCLWFYWVRNDCGCFPPIGGHMMAVLLIVVSLLTPVSIGTIAPLPDSQLVGTMSNTSIAKFSFGWREIKSMQICSTNLNILFNPVMRHAKLMLIRVTSMSLATRSWVILVFVPPPLKLLDKWSSPNHSSQKMEQELGVTISNAVDDFTPSADHIDHLVTRETDSTVILTARIKGAGYEREHVEVLIKEDGSRIAIRTQKPYLENWKVGWKMRNAKTKVFKIPDGVILDKIKAMFNEEEWIVTISMPKATKGIGGIGVGEVIEELVVEKSSILPDEKKKEQKSGSSRLENHDQGIGIVKSTRVVHDQVSQEKGHEIAPLLVEKDLVVEGSTHDEIHRMQGKMEGEESGREERPQGVTKPKEDKSDHQIDKIDASVLKQVPYVVQEVEGDKQRRETGQHKEDEKNGSEKMHEEVYRDDPPKKEKERSLDDEATQKNQPPGKRSMICAPVVAGSAILVSVIVVVVHLIRKQKQA